MKRLFRIRTAIQLLKYKVTLSGEKLGWIVYESDVTFSPVHRVLGDPEHGPVILIGDEVWEVDLDRDFYHTEALARAAYWAQK